MALRGITVIELAGLAPVPFCGMLMSDAGARVINVKSHKPNLTDGVFARGKESVTLNLKDKIHLKAFKKLCSAADVLIEPFRPGVMERLSLGPDVLLHENPRLVFARMSGFGQSESPMKFRAGHDINYLSLSGVLACLRRANGLPNPPINLLADFAGGSVLGTVGILMALLEREKSGKGQVVDCSLTDGAAYLSSFLWLSRKIPIWDEKPGYGLLDGGSHSYQCYRTKDDKFVAVGSIEPQFYENLLNGLGITLEDAPIFDLKGESKEKIQSIFLTKTRDEWTSIFKDTDSCVTPVLEIDEAPHTELSKACSSFMIDDEGTISPSPSPKLSSHKDLPVKASWSKKTTYEIFSEHGISKADIEYITKPLPKL